MAQPLPQKWVDLFKSKSAVVTEYAAHHPIHLSNVLLENQDLSKSTYPDAVFENTVWNHSVAIGANFINTKFIGGSITDSGFSDSVFTNVTFDGVTITGAEFISSTFINTTFKNCKIYNSELHNLEPSTFTIEDSELNKVNFFQSAMDLTLKNSRVIELGDFSGLVAGSKITLDHSYIGPYSDFQFQKGLSRFTANNSEITRFALVGKIDKIVLNSTKVDISIGTSTINDIEIHNSQIHGLEFGDGGFMRHMAITDCKPSGKLDAYKGHIGELYIRNCDFDSIVTYGATISHLSIVNSKIGKFVGKQLKAKDITLQRVTFTGKTSFNTAIADKTAITDVTIAPTATLDMTDSNIPLKR